MRHSPGPRILHVSRPVEGGVAQVVTDLARAQAATGADVHVACPDEGMLPRVWDTADGGVRGHPWTASRSPGPQLAAEVRDLARVIARVRPALVHAHSAKAGLAARLALRGRVPTVFQPHAWSFEAVGGVTAPLTRCWERRAARWTDRIVCVSEAEWITGRRAGVTGAYTVIPNGVDVARFAPGRRSEARRRLLPDSFARAPLVVCVGRLCRQKGQDVLLRAWAAVAEALPGARLVLVGDGPDAAGLRDLADTTVTFAGATDDTACWYRAADVVVLPSRWEGMALAPLEAMACGRPVVVTDVDGARESLPPADRAHALVPPSDPATLARALLALLRDGPLRAELGRRGRRHVLDHHDARRTASAIDAVYRELLGPAPTTYPATAKYRECTTT
ncbi:glycosyltransferase family 1 protein [Streptomyces alfalfae]|uniref:Glycosyl transferase family 1 n=1 Tax=Streptomyces alfalfae TaxID=1642299 RepID=A0ABN4VN36_9ACTN|nr:glycosyltransferase [Streptomyces alfalfae]APY87198.1 glycosyl transferase family 1 [Streptomyces alfalfae]AYA17599.1 glycosyltransferase family 1 protein [Streptomyces fradiae]RXX44810.1 glycosyltransferase family 1 protein [Streptomyces alfalfae]RZM95395.1 glycosyltransferase family 1 protein [Streptomyces alfalfae]